MSVGRSPGNGLAMLSRLVTNRYARSIATVKPRSNYLRKPAAPVSNSESMLGRFGLVVVGHECFAPVFWFRPKIHSSKWRQAAQPPCHLESRVA